MSALRTVDGRVDPAELVRALRAGHTITDDADLVELTWRPLGAGAAADTFRVELHWRRARDGPQSVVAKLPALDEQAARTSASLGLYEREGRFYAELAVRTAVSVPRLLGLMRVDGAPVGLLLEDLSSSESADQLTDLPLERLQAARRELVALQAPFWDDPATAALPWLHRRLGVPIPGIVDRMRRSWSSRGEELAAEFDPEERAIIDRFVAGVAEWAESLGGPYSLTHHDYRVDNLLFRGTQVVVLDWQTAGWGPPMFDLAYLLGTSVGTETRRTIEREEVVRHVEDLAAAGVRCSPADAWRSYRQASPAVLLMLIPPTGSVKRSPRSDAMFRRLLRHGARMALDLDAAEFLAPARA